MGKQAVKPCIASAAAATAAVGADFVLYGLIEDAKYVFPSCDDDGHSLQPVTD